MAVRRTARQGLLLVHVLCSLGWLGAGAANLVLAVTALDTTDVVLRRSCYQLIDVIDFALVIPLAFSALASGVVIGLATKWRLLRHWWVLVKLALTVVVIVFSTFGVGVWVEQSIQATTPPSLTASPVAVPLVVGAAANIVAFVFMTWASIVKPWGKTPWLTSAGTRTSTTPSTTTATTRPGARWPSGPDRFARSSRR